MTKRQLIDDIMRLNRSATPEFLAQFEENELDLYLQRLLKLRYKLGRDDLLEPVSLAELESI